MRNVCRQLIVSSALGLALCLLWAPKAFADGCNLDTDTATCGALTTALYAVVDPHSTGTGYIDSFLRVQMDGTEEGFSTDARVGSPATAGYCDGAGCVDSKTDPNYTHTVLTSSALVTISGEQYLSFLLDINEPNGNDKEFLTLDQLEIYTSSDIALDSHTSAPEGSTGSLTGGTLLYSLDSGLDNWINLDYSLINHNGGGSGWGDMQVLIPVSGLLEPLNTYLYLYSEFGCIGTCDAVGPANNMISTAKYSSADGFEEWWVDRRNNGGGGGGPINAIPEPGTLFLVATGAALVARRRRRQLK